MGNPSNTLPGFSSPHASPDAPLDMLAACHERVTRQCATLRRLGPHLQQHGSDRAAQEAAQAVRRYFNQAAPKHHADEEDDLFPALLQHAGPDTPALAAVIATLRQQHRDFEQWWHTLDAVLARLEAGHNVVWPQALVDQFTQGYDAHMALEDTQVLPAAQRWLPASTQSQIAHAMRTRRGL